MKNIDKEFVPYQEALELNELGFDFKCVNYYSHYGNGQVHLNNFVTSSKIGVETNRDKGILAPLYQQAFRWFRENYGLYHSIGLDDSLENNINCDYQIINHSQSISELETNFKSYEEAELECLKKLIEIVKNK
jgi:hypothetical protein